MRELVPWWGRIGAKIVLSRVPAGYSLWRKLHIFTHGAMHQSEYALGVFRQHFARSGLVAGQKFVALEIGPGDSVSSALIAAAHGAQHTYLVDAGPFATAELDVYRSLAQYLHGQGLTPPAIDGARDLNGLLSVCGATYGTAGLKSLRAIPTASVDFIWSHAVLEHIRRHEFAEFMRETRRVLRPGGLCSHQIDLRDHLGGALNNMRISSRWWEAPWMASSGFYTNRLKKSEILQMFAAAGFVVEVVSVSRWDRIPTQPHLLAAEFRGIATDELLVSGFTALLRPV